MAKATDNSTDEWWSINDALNYLINDVHMEPDAASDAIAAYLPQTLGCVVHGVFHPTQVRHMISTHRISAQEFKRKMPAAVAATKIGSAVNTLLGTTKRRRAPQADRVRRALPKVYPDGVPDNIPTATVQGKINTELASEDKKHDQLGDVSWDVVNEVLGRKKKK